MEVRLPRLGIYAELLADPILQEIAIAASREALAKWGQI
jgi:hypothetical protein